MCLVNTTSASIRRLLRSNHVLQRDLAKELGMYPQELSNKLNGHRTFTLRDISRIADYFGVTTDYLLGRDSEEAER